MQLLKKIIHNDIKNINGIPFIRRTARGIILDGTKILLMYTKSYNDYSFPGGGVNEEEDLTTGLQRELYEETGATNIEVLDEYGMIDEYRPSRDSQFDVVHMKSYFFICKIDKELGTPELEDYEIAHGMNAVWVELDDAIRHNKEVIGSKPDSMGFSIKRETFVLEHIRDHLI